MHSHTISIQDLEDVIILRNIYLVANCNWRQNYDKNEDVMTQSQLIFKL